MVRTVLIVDDHPGFLACARSLLHAEGLRVVGQATTGADALAQAARLSPDLVILDVRLPDTDGFEVSRRLGALEPPPVVVLTSSDARAEIDPLVARSGARGFLPKESLSGATLRAMLA